MHQNHSHLEGSLVESVCKTVIEVDNFFTVEDFYQYLLETSEKQLLSYGQSCWSAIRHCACA